MVKQASYDLILKHLESAMRRTEAEAVTLFLGFDIDIRPNYIILPRHYNRSESDPIPKPRATVSSPNLLSSTQGSEESSPSKNSWNWSFMDRFKGTETPNAKSTPKQPSQPPSVSPAVLRFLRSNSDLAEASFQARVPDASRSTAHTPSPLSRDDIGGGKLPPTPPPSTRMPSTARFEDQTVAGGDPTKEKPEEPSYMLSNSSKSASPSASHTQTEGKSSLTGQTKTPERSGFMNAISEFASLFDTPESVDDEFARLLNAQAKVEIKRAKLLRAYAERLDVLAEARRDLAIRVQNRAYVRSFENDPFKL